MAVEDTKDKRSETLGLVKRHFENVVAGQGLAGSAMAWTLHWEGQSVLLLDKGERYTASRVSAGLITPVTGKRLVLSAKYGECFAAAKHFYRRVEKATGQTFFTEVEMLRLFEDEAARTEFLERSAKADLSGISEWSGQLQSGKGVHIGIRMSQSGRLDVTKYLSATRRYFEQADSYCQTDLLEEKVKLKEETRQTSAVITLTEQAVTANRLIMCTGATTTKLFPEVPDNPARGDILKVGIGKYKRKEVVHRSIWIVAEEDGTQTVGSTYDWNNRIAEPTKEGRQEILGRLSRLIEGPVKVLDQVAAVRPTMKDYEPVLGRHSKWPNILVFNGLGSKGTLLAPSMAKNLVESMEGTTKLATEQDYERLKVNTTTKQRPLTSVAQQAVAAVLKGGETVVDATVGNGFDTNFLAEAVGTEGQVIGFDVQRKAIESTSKRLAAGGLTNVELREQSHAELGAVVAEGTVTAVMFNLGFLPRSDKTIVTTAASSTKAITAALEVLKQHGILTILVYRGHEGGQDEYEAIERLLQEDGLQYEQQRIDSVPSRPTSPVLFILKKTVNNE